MRFVAPIALLCAIVLTNLVSPTTSSLAAYSETRSFRDALEGRSMEEAISGPVDKDTSSYGDRTASSGSGSSASPGAGNGQQSGSSMMYSIPANGNLNNMQQQQQSTTDTAAGEEQQKSANGGSEIEREAGPIDGMPMDTQQQMMEQKAGRLRSSNGGGSRAGRLMTGNGSMMQKSSRLQQQQESSSDNAGTKNSDAGFGDDTQTQMNGGAKRAAGPMKPANSYAGANGGESQKSAQSQGGYTPSSMAQNMIMSLANKAAYANVQQQMMSQRQVAPPMMMAANGYGRSVSRAMGGEMGAASPMYNSMVMQQPESGMGAAYTNGNGNGNGAMQRRGGMRRAKQRRPMERKMSPAMVNAMLNKMLGANKQQAASGETQMEMANGAMNGAGYGPQAAQMMMMMKPANSMGMQQMMKMRQPMKAEMLANMMMMQQAEMTAMTPAKREQYKKMMMAAIMQQQSGGSQERDYGANGGQQQEEQQPEQQQQQTGDSYGEKSMTGTKNSGSNGANGYAMTSTASPMPMSMVMNMMGAKMQAANSGYGMGAGMRAQAPAASGYGSRSMGKMSPGEKGSMGGYGAMDSQQQQQEEQQPEQQKQTLETNGDSYGAQDQQQQTPMQMPMSPLMMMMLMNGANGNSMASQMGPRNGKMSPAASPSYDNGAAIGMGAMGSKGRSMESSMGMPMNGKQQQYRGPETTTQSSYAGAQQQPEMEQQQREMTATMMPPMAMGGASGKSSGDGYGSPMAAMNGGSMMSPMNGFRQAYNPQDQQQQQQDTKSGTKRANGGSQMQMPTTTMMPMNGGASMGTKGSGDYPQQQQQPMATPMQPKQMSYGQQAEMGDEQEQQQQQDEYGAAPMGQAEPFAFDYKIDDNYGNSQYRKEESDKNGVVRGSYGYMDNSGIYRHVEYVADENGFRANVKSNEPGVSTEPASAPNGNGKMGPSMDSPIGAMGQKGGQPTQQQAVDSTQMAMSPMDVASGSAAMGQPSGADQQQQMYPSQAQEGSEK